VELDHSPTGHLGRRRLFGATVGGALSLVPFLSGRASAGSGETTTTPPPRRPTDDDVVLLSFAQTVEWAARDLYDIALDGDSLDDTVRPVVQTIREAHESYAQAISAMLGREAPNEAAAEVVEVLSEAFGGAQADVMEAAVLLESTAVATHENILGLLDGVDGSELVASILIVEARHGTVLRNLAGVSELDDLLFTEEADALTPAEG
jgi:hypothetical protein